MSKWENMRNKRHQWSTVNINAERQLSACRNSVPQVGLDTF